MNTTVLQVIDEATILDISSLERKGKEFNFSDVFPMLKEGLESIIEIKDNKDFWNSVPLERQRNIEQAMNNLVGTAKRIADFEPTKLENPLRIQEKLSNEVRSYHSNLYETLLLPLKIHQIQFTKSAKELSKMIKETKLQLESSKEEGEQVLRSIKQLATSAGTGKLSRIFYQQSLLHAAIAMYWLSAGILFVGLSARFAWTKLLAPAISALNANGITIGSSMLESYFVIFLSFSFFTYVTHQILKNYSANMHLYSINKHRSNIMNTFFAFADSANEKVTEDNILFEATRSVFSYEDSGFVNSKEGDKSEINILDKFVR